MRSFLSLIRSTTNETQTTGQATSQSTKTPPTTANEKKNTVSISKAKYNQLKYGDTYEKIKSLLGGTGEVFTESGTKGSKSYTVTYLCHVKSPSGGEVFLAFKRLTLKPSAMLGANSLQKNPSLGG